MLLTLKYRSRPSRWTTVLGPALFLFVVTTLPVERATAQAPTIPVIERAGTPGGGPVVDEQTTMIAPGWDRPSAKMSPAEQLLSEGIASDPFGRSGENAIPAMDGFVQVGDGKTVETRILEAIREGRNEGRYRVVTQGLTNRIPFGYTKPTLYCEPLRASLIRLEPGETVWAAIPADPVSWSVQLSESGPGGITPIVVVKPLTEESVLTNLFISTDRRIYEVMLQSGTDEARTALTVPDRSSILDFYYPEDVIRTVEGASSRARKREAAVDAFATTAAPAELTSGIPLDRMRFSYTWTKDRNFPWEPESVFDDGAHVYITLPATARHEAGAVLFVKGLNGENTLLEYAVRDGRIITDRVFREAQFIYAEPSKRKKPKRYVLTIKNRDR